MKQVYFKPKVLAVIFVFVGGILGFMYGFCTV